MPDEHLTTEEISALLDRGTERTAGSEHLESCAACRREMELLRRMRMALSALDDRKAPAGAWASIEDELEERGVAGREASDAAPDGDSERPTSAFVREMSWLRAAAAVLIFAGGLGLGTAISSPDGAGDEAGDRLAAADRPAEATAREDAATSSPAPDEAASREGAGASDAGEAAAPTGQEADRRERTPADAGAGDVTIAPTTFETARPSASRGTLAAAGPACAGGGGDLTYRDAMERLERLRARGPSLREAYRNPEAAAEHLARLEALMRASREALREDPADPALNDFLFRVAEERAAFGRALRLSSLEYR